MLAVRTPGRSPRQAMPSGLRHLAGKGLDADLADALNTGSPVGTQHKADDAADEVVELGALARIRRCSALGTSPVRVLATARADPAPRRLVVGRTARATLFAVGPTRRTVEPAWRHQFRIHFDALHQRSLPPALGRGFRGQLTPAMVGKRRRAVKSVASNITGPRLDRQNPRLIAFRWCTPLTCTGPPRV